jgi:broad-specificity NMP kinase
MELKDYIFVTGASGIGKTTLANGLLAHYKTTCIEQNMIPEFISRDGIEPMTGELGVARDAGSRAYFYERKF